MAYKLARFDFDILGLVASYVLSAARLPRPCRIEQRRIDVVADAEGKHAGVGGCCFDPEVLQNVRRDLISPTVGWPSVKNTMVNDRPACQSWRKSYFGLSQCFIRSPPAGRSRRLSNPAAARFSICSFRCIDQPLSSILAHACREVQHGEAILRIGGGEAMPQRLLRLVHLDAGHAARRIEDEHDIARHDPGADVVSDGGLIRNRSCLRR